MITRLVIILQPVSKYLLIAWILAILIVSSIPSIPTLKIHTAKSDIRLDYLIHFCEYGFLSFLAFLSFAGSEFRIPLIRVLLVTLGVVCFAVIDEFHQKFIPGRTFNPKDLISNICGIACALAFCIVVFRKIAKVRTMQK
jgi:VanZ family protein